jgi:DNA-binding NarL/FixJ family response regulator
VAKALQISIRTVNTHVTNILNKTGKNRTVAGALSDPLQAGIYIIIRRCASQCIITIQNQYFLMTVLRRRML